MRFGLERAKVEKGEEGRWRRKINDWVFAREEMEDGRSTVRL